MKITFDCMHFVINLMNLFAETLTLRILGVEYTRKSIQGQNQLENLDLKWLCIYAENALRTSINMKILSWENFLTKYLYVAA